jgi:hypothetical protein
MIEILTPAGTSITVEIGGVMGPRGFTGETGPQGPQGIQGETGAQGPEGPQGIQGETGATGATGAQGPQGEQGLKGDKGDKGDTGEQGLKGDTGDTGPAGSDATVNAENVASVLDAATEATEPEDANKIPLLVAGALRWVSFANLWTLIVTKIGAITSITAGGVWSFGSPTRPTSSATGAPLSNSLIMLSDGDARYGPVIVANSTGVTDAPDTTYVDVAGCTSIQLEANTRYEIGTYAYFNCIPGWFLRLVFSADLYGTSGRRPASNMGQGSALPQQAQFIGDLRTIQLGTRAVNTGGNQEGYGGQIMILTTATAPTVTLQFSNTGAGTANLTYATVIIRKLS